MVRSLFEEFYPQFRRLSEITGDPYDRVYEQRTDKDSERRLLLYKLQSGKCHWCREIMSLDHFHITEKGKIKDNGRFATFEHLLPRSKGGTWRKGNIVLAHGSCNHHREKMKWPHDPIYGKNPLKSLKDLWAYGVLVQETTQCGPQKSLKTGTLENYFAYVKPKIGDAAIAELG